MNKYDLKVINNDKSKKVKQSSWLKLPVLYVSVFCISNFSGEVINSAINANFEQFIIELKPIIEKALSKFMLESADGIATSFPYKDLFPANWSPELFQELISVLNTKCKGKDDVSPSFKGAKVCFSYVLQGSVLGPTLFSKALWANSTLTVLWY